MASEYDDVMFSGGLFSILCLFFILYLMCSIEPVPAISIIGPLKCMHLLVDLEVCAQSDVEEQCADVDPEEEIKDIVLQA